MAKRKARSVDGWLGHSRLKQEVNPAWFGSTEAACAAKIPWPQRIWWKPKLFRLTEILPKSKKGKKNAKA